MTTSGSGAADPTVVAIALGVFVLAAIDGAFLGGAAAIMSTIFTFILGLIALRKGQQRKTNGDPTVADEEIRQLKARIADLEADVALQHKLKHAADGALIVARGTLTVVHDLAAKCKCGALDTIAPLIEAIATEVGLEEVVARKKRR